jgi:hypothetical protein
MRLAGIRVGDIVQADVRGQRFHALVTDYQPHPESSRALLFVESLSRQPIPTRCLTARQVVGHFRKVKA